MAFAIQDHIHLSTTPADVTGNVTTSKWNVILDGWSFNPEVTVSLVRTAGGTLRPYAMKTSAGAIVMPRNYTYTLKLDAAFSETVQQREDRLLAMFGKTVTFHPHYHDEASHATSVRTYFMSPPSSWQTLTAMLTLQLVSIQLIEVL